MNTNLLTVTEKQPWYDPGLKPNVRNIIQAAQSCGQISTQEIAAFLPHDLVRDRVRLARLLKGLIDFLKENKVALVSFSAPRVKQSPLALTLVSKEPVVRPLKKKLGYSQEGELQVDRGTEDPEPEDNGDVLARYFRDIRPYNRTLSHEEVRELCRKIHEEQDLDARNLLVLHNQRLLLKIARRYLGRGLEYADLVQEGQFGLLKAAEKLDPNQGAFSTYAHWWVKQTITHAIADTGSLIRSPVYAHELYNKVVKIAEQVSWKLGRPPSEEEIAEVGGLPLATVQKALHHLKIPTVSLAAPTGWAGKEDDNDSPLENFIADERMVAPDEALMQSEALEETRDGLEEFLLVLSNLCRYRKRDFAIFFLRYGLDNDFQGRTLEEVAKAFKITRERVRQICALIWKSLGKEGHWSEADLLLDIERLHGLENVVQKEATPKVPFNGIDFSGVDLAQLVNEKSLPPVQEIHVRKSIDDTDRYIKNSIV